MHCTCLQLKSHNFISLLAQNLEILLFFPHSFPVDLVVCSALGADMYDCVYPTRTGVSVHAIM